MLEQMLANLENKAFSACQNVSPQHGTIHDYANILRQVTSAERALNNAVNALHRADKVLTEIKAAQ